MIISARYIVPVVGPVIEGGAIHFDGSEITKIESSWQGKAEHDFGDAVILPGLINTHTHLEFSQLQAPLGDSSHAFPDWIRSVINWRRSQDASTQNQRTQASVALGLQESLRAGVTTVGEIATYYAATERGESESTGGWPQVVSFRELLGLAPERAAALLDLAQQHLGAETNGIAGLSPHSPYTVHPDLLARVCSLSAASEFPIAMHMAESREELQLIGEQSGALQQMLADIGAWPDGVFNSGTRPLDYLTQLQRAWRCLVVHGNYLDDEELDYLAANRDSMSLVYCPRTHRYFGHDRYPLATAVARGVRVVLGTDSRASNPDLSLLSEMRFVVRNHRDVAPQDVLEMATIRAAESLGLENDRGSLEVGKRADLAVLPIDKVPLDKVSLDPLDVILKTDCEPIAVFANGRSAKLK